MLAFLIIAGGLMAVIMISAWNSPDIAPRYYAQADGEPHPRELFGGKWETSRVLHDDHGSIQLWYQPKQAAPARDDTLTEQDWAEYAQAAQQGVGALIDKALADADEIGRWK